MTKRTFTPLSILGHGLHYTFWTLLFVVLPLFVDPSAFVRGFSAEQTVLLPKAFILGLTCVVGMFALLVSYPEVSFASLLRRARSWPLALQVMLGLSTFLLIDAWFVPGVLSVNLIGNPFRVDGFLVQAAWYSLAPMAGGLVYAHNGNVRQPLLFLITGALLAALWTLSQAYGFEPVLLFYPEIEGFNTERIAFGPASLTGLTAGYLAVVLTLWLVLQRRFSLLSALGMALLAAALVATGNRTSLGALILMVMVLIGAYLWQRRYRQLWVLVSCVLIAILAVGTLQVTRPGSFEQVERTKRFIEGEDSSWQLRVIFWQAALRGLFDRPLTGQGPNGFDEMFWKHTTLEEQLRVVRPRLPDDVESISRVGGGLFLLSLPDREERQPYILTIDKAHNYLLDIVVAGGWPALLLFSTAVIAGVWMMLRSSLRVSQAVACSIIVYMLFGLTWFATLQVDPIVWGLFGIGVGAAWAERAATSSDTSPEPDGAA